MICVFCSQKLVNLKQLSLELAEYIFRENFQFLPRSKMENYIDKVNYLFILSQLYVFMQDKYGFDYENRDDNLMSDVSIRKLFEFVGYLDNIEDGIKYICQSTENELKKYF